MVTNGATGRMFPSGVETLPTPLWSPSSRWWLFDCGDEGCLDVSSSVEWAASWAICASALRAVSVISATSILVTEWTEDVELCRENPAIAVIFCRWSCSARSFSAMLCVHTHNLQDLTFITQAPRLSHLLLLETINGRGNLNNNNDQRHAYYY